jgi:hypothetical protein
MSIAMAQKLRELEQHILDISRTLTDTKALIRDLEQRLQNIEARPKLGRPPKES